MKIDVFALLHNEIKILPYFLRHYQQFADVTFLEGHSTDGSPEYAEKMGAKVIKVDTNNEIRDDLFLKIKNNCWKESDADWVIICDTDEFVFAPNIKESLSKTDGTIMIPKLWNMFSEVFPTTEGQIYEEVNMGVEGGGKFNLFKPKEIQEINYTIGCHTANPTGNVRVVEIPEIITLHFRHLSREYVVAKNHYLNPRQSQVNRSHGWGYHTKDDASATDAFYDSQIPLLQKVL